MSERPITAPVAKRWRTGLLRSPPLPTAYRSTRSGLRPDMLDAVKATIIRGVHVVSELHFDLDVARPIRGRVRDIRATRIASSRRLRIGKDRSGERTDGAGHVIHELVRRLDGGVRN